MKLSEKVKGRGSWVWVEQDDTISRRTRAYALLETEMSELTALEQDRVRLREAVRWLVHLANGVGKSGGPPTSDEWEAAWREARAAAEQGGPK